jgi:hypothetical protein
MMNTKSNHANATESEQNQQPKEVGGIKLAATAPTALIAGAKNGSTLLAPRHIRFESQSGL